METPSLRLRIALLLASLFLVPAVSLAQAPRPSLSVPHTDVYAGFMVNVPDFKTVTGSVHNLEGYELAFTLHFGDRFGLTASGAELFGSGSNQFQLTAGPRFNILTGRFRPYGTAQFGVSNQDSDTLHPGELTAAFSRRNALTYRVGGGADYQLTRRVYWRIGQWTAQPVPWGRHASSLFQNFSTGLGYQF
jgi:opacity protein-like surface antigen